VLVFLLWGRGLVHSSAVVAMAPFTGRTKFSKMDHITFKKVASHFVLQQLFSDVLSFFLTRMNEVADSFFFCLTT